MAFKLTLDFKGKEFKQQYIQLLAQQLPLAEIDKLKSSNITITVTNLGTNNAVIDDTDIKIPLLRSISVILSQRLLRRP